MSKSNGGLSDSAWIEMDSGIVAPKRRGIQVEGAFRMAGAAGGGMPAFDTGWIPNCITYVGVLSILDRFISKTIDATVLAGSSVTHADAIVQPRYIGVGTGTSADYFQDDDLGSEISYAVAGRPVITDTRIVAGPTGASGKAVSRNAIVSADITAGKLVAADGYIAITELGLYSGPTTEGSDFYAATTFTAITVSGAQAFTVFYSIGLSQAA